MVNLRPTIRLALSSLKRKFPSVDKPLRILAPPKISPSKRAFEKYKPRGLFSEFYGMSYVSSASGEPAQCMACSCLFAVKHAVEEARGEVGKGEEYFVMSE